jgi:hypothetical protein
MNIYKIHNQKMNNIFKMFTDEINKINKKLIKEEPQILGGAVSSKSGLERYISASYGFKLKNESEVSVERVENSYELLLHRHVNHETEYIVKVNQIPVDGRYSSKVKLFKTIEELHRIQNW